MYCPQCGYAISDQEKLTHCPQCQTALPPVSMVSKIPAWANWLVRPHVFGLLLLLLVGVPVVGGLTWWSSHHLGDPVPVVRDFYQAIASGKQNNAVDYLLPSSRSQGLNNCLHLLMQPNVSIVFQNPQFKVVTQTKTSAKVRITGKANETTGGQLQQISFNDVLDLTADNFHWYINYDSLSNLSLCGP